MYYGSASFIGTQLILLFFKSPYNSFWESHWQCYLIARSAWVCQGVNSITQKLLTILLESPQLVDINLNIHLIFLILNMLGRYSSLILGVSYEAELYPTGLLAALDPYDLRHAPGQRSKEVWCEQALYCCFREWAGLVDVLSFPQQLGKAGQRSDQCWAVTVCNTSRSNRVLTATIVFYTPVPSSFRVSTLLVQVEQIDRYHPLCL